MRALPPVGRPISAFFLLVAVTFAPTPSLPASAALPAAARSPGFLMSGAVVDARSRTPLAKTLVIIIPSAAPGMAHAKITLTGADGRFEFASLPAGKYNLQAARRGYRQQAFEEHDGYSTAIVVGPGLQSGNLLFRLRPDAAVSGRVADEQNDAVRDARVSLYQFQPIPGRLPAFLRASTTSSDEGSFIFDHLAPGKYLVAVSAQPWYADRTQPVARFRPAPSSDVPLELLDSNNPELDVAYPTGFYPAGFSAGSGDPSRAQPMVLSPGSHETADIVLRAVPALHLRLLSSSAAPISEVTVKQQLLGNEIPVLARSIRYENDFELTGLAPGQYLFEVHSSSGAASRLEVDASGDRDIDVSSSLPAAMVSGSVTIEPSQNLAGNILIAIMGESGEYSSQVSPGGKIKFSQPVPPGRYTVNLGAPGWIIKRLAATGATVSGQTIQITGQGPVELEIGLSKSAAQVDGIVLEDGKPVSGAMVLLVPENAANNLPLFRRDQSDSDGTFTLRSVVPGKYALLAIKNRWDLEWGNPAVLKPYMREAQTLQAEPKGKYQVKLTVQGSGP